MTFTKNAESVSLEDADTEGMLHPFSDRAA
jgi:hypothetical protein